jgi:hypothetical protein
MPEKPMPIQKALGVMAAKANGAEK